MVRIRRGDIWMADLGDPYGSAPGFVRPVLLIQENRFNDSAIATIVTIALTSNLDYARFPGNILLHKEESGLSKESVINVSQIATIDKSQLIELAGSIPELIMDQVEYGISIVLGFK